MSGSKISLNDLESIMKAAEVESALLQSDNQESPVDSNTQMEEKSNETAALPKIPSIQNPDDVKEALKNTNISTILNQMAENPDEVSRMMTESMNHFTPDMMEQARKLAMGGQGDKIMKEMKKRGINPKAMKAQVSKQKKVLRALKTPTITKQVVLITTSRQARSRRLPLDNILPSVSNILKCSEPVELSCSRLAQGPLAGKTIKVWYNPENIGKNRRATKLVGFPVGGEIIIVMEEGDLTEEILTLAEKHLE